MNSKTMMSILIFLVIATFGLSIFGIHQAFKAVSGDDDEFMCYTASTIEVDGDELTEEGVREQYGIRGIEEVMALYLKDTGDCGLILQGEGLVGRWSQKDSTITVDAAAEKISLDKNLDALIYKTDFKGKEVRFVLRKTDDLPKCFKTRPQLTYGIDYTSGLTANLTNFMLGGQYTIKGDVVYGKFFDLGESGDNSVLGKCKTNGSGYSEIASGGQARYLTVSEGYLYYKWISTSDGAQSICRVNIRNNAEDTGVQILREGNCDYVQMRFGKVYFTDENQQFCRMDPDGSNAQVLIDRAVFMPYVIDDGWVIFQDDGDGEKLHLATLNGKFEQTLTDRRSYGWIIQGRKLYYTGTQDETDEFKHKCNLFQMDIGNLNEIADTETKAGEGQLGDMFALNSSEVYGGNAESVPLDEWTSLANNLYEGGYYENSLMYLSNQFKITGQVNEDFAFKGLTLTNLSDGSTIDLLHKEQL